MAASDWYAYQDLLFHKAILSFTLRDVKCSMFYASTPHHLVFKLNATSQDAVRRSVMLVMFDCTDACKSRVAALWDTEIKSIVCNVFLILGLRRQQWFPLAPKKSTTSYRIATEVTRQWCLTWLSFLVFFVCFGKKKKKHLLGDINTLLKPLWKMFAPHVQTRQRHGSKPSC